ncbi:hypothetical protein AWC36_05195 [Brenneria goodwinii]|uniref:phage tail fiber protein n=1 Tax=Brenneria goodwinii TaxID=1109412 RepID=UPI000BAE787A|nr:hypothetical protein [Brenneria goodwinii]ATA23549.1 hypothetical protein AWC36_05195 [Brenneria goodwinii]
MPTYRTGTATLTNGSKTVTGSGTQWANAINGVFPGMMFIGPDGKINIIATVASSTSLTLEDNYTGSTASGQAYKIITTYEGDISQFSARFTALLARFEGNSDVLYTWLTSTAATMTWTKADGTTETVATLSAITATVPVARGGTGATTAAQARANLGLGSIAVLNSPLPKANGGSGTVLGAFGNLEPHAETDMASLLAYLASADQRNNLAGSVSVNNVWKTVLSVRHRAGLTDGTAYGCVLVDEGMTTVGYGNNFALYKQVANTWLAPVYLWHSGNLVKQASTTDATAGAVMINGAWGLGSAPLTFPNANNAMNLSTSSPLFIRSSAVSSENSNWPTSAIAWRGIQIPWDSAARSQIAIGYSSNDVGLYVRTRTAAGNESPWYRALTSNIYTVDANGFIKTASPVVKLFSDGSIEANDEATGVKAEKIGIGEYCIAGCLGFNSDPAWGGIDGGIEIPLDTNKQPLIWINSTVEADGSIIIRTYHRTHPNAPKFAQNNIDSVENGQPIDIPAGRWIDVRVQMPGSDETESLLSEPSESMSE